MGGARALLTVAALLVGFQTLATAMWQAVQADLQADAADLHVQGVLTDETRAALAALPGVARVQVVDRAGRVAVGDGVADVWAFDPGEGLPVGLSAGDPAAAVAALRQGGAALVGSRLAARLGLRPGDPLELAPAWGGAGPAPRRTVTVAGVYPDTRDFPTLYLSRAEAAALGLQLKPVRVLVRLAPGTDPAATADAIRSRLPEVGVETRAEGLAAARQTHRERTGLFLATLYLLGIFGALGIVQAAALAVLDQRRELALLRAAGATPGQILVLVLVQGAVPGVLAALLGAGSGLALGHGLLRLLAARVGVAPTGIPLSEWVPAAAMAGLALLAALPPAAASARQPAAAAL